MILSLIPENCRFHDNHPTTKPSKRDSFGSLFQASHLFDSNDCPYDLSFDLWIMSLSFQWVKEERDMNGHGVPNQMIDLLFFFFLFFSVVWVPSICRTLASQSPILVCGFLLGSYWDDWFDGTWKRIKAYQAQLISCSHSMNPYLASIVIIVIILLTSMLKGLIEHNSDNNFMKSLRLKIIYTENLLAQHDSLW